MSNELKKKVEGSPQEAALKAYNDIRHLESRLEAMIDTHEDGTKNRISFGVTVLSCVAQGNYDRALKELECVGDGLEAYYLFKILSRRYVDHAKSLVASIKAKYMVGRASRISKSKQKELSDKIADHFLELKTTIIMIEKIQKNVRAEDLGSTVYLVKTLFYAVMVVALAASFFYANEYLGVNFEQLFSLELPH